MSAMGSKQTLPRPYRPITLMRASLSQWRALARGSGIVWI
jgi:hypothetical protein